MKVVQTRQAGPDHAVTTYKGDSLQYCSAPCGECPWRRSNAGKFPAESFVLASDVSHDGSLKQFGCHMAGERGEQLICAGFAMRSHHNFALRFAAMAGHVPRLTDPGEDVLFEDYRDMAEANDVSRSHPCLRASR